MHRKILPPLLFSAFACFFNIPSLFAGTDWQREYQPDENTVALWHFNEGQGKTARDEHGGKNNATLFNMNDKAWVAGQTNFGTALFFDGHDDYVSVPDSTGLNLTNSLLLEAWVKPESVSESMILDKQGRYSLGLNGSSEFQFGLKVSGAYQSVAGRTIVQTGQWYHVAGAYDGRVMRLFVNGALEGSRECSGDIEVVRRPLTIGALTAEGKNRAWFKGVIDEARVSVCPVRDLSDYVLNVPKATVPPKIDGILDDPCWDNAAMADNFVRMDGNAATKPTKARVVYDRENLYVAFECFQPAGEKVIAAVTERDGMVCADDSAELVIDPDNSRDAFYQLIANSLGTVFDSHSSVSAAISDPKWNFEKLSLAAKTESDRWIVEAAVPAKEIGLGELKEGMVFGINFVRSDRSAREFSGWVQVRGSHHPAYFGRAIMGKFQDEIKARLTELEGELNAKVGAPLQNAALPAKERETLGREAENLKGALKKLAEEADGRPDMTLTQWRDLSAKIKAQNFPDRIRRLSWLRTDYMVWYQEDTAFVPDILPPAGAKSLQEMKLTAFPGDYRKIEVLVTGLQDQPVKVVAELSAEKKLADKVRILKSEAEAGKNTAGNITLLLLTAGLTPGQYEGGLELQIGEKKEKIKLILNIIPGVSIVASDLFIAPQRWLPKKIAGKDFWNMFRHNVFRSVQKEPAIKEDFFEESVLRVGFYKEYRTGLREMEVFAPEQNDNLALGAKPLGEEGTKNISAVNDGNLKTEAVGKSGRNAPVAGWYGLEFARKTTLSRIKLYHPPSSFTPDDFICQYWDGTSWQDIPQTRTKGNKAEMTEHVFPALSTEKVRVFINSERAEETGKYPAGEEWRWLFAQFKNNLDYEKIIKDRPFLMEVYERRPQEAFAKTALESLKGRFNGNFLGFGIGEWPNDGREIYKELKKAGTEINKASASAKNDELLRQFMANMNGCFYNMWSAQFWGHHGMECGCSLSACETTQRAGLAHHQTQTAFTRGAARQYDKPWYMYFAYDLVDSNVSHDLATLEKRRAKLAAGATPNWMLGPDSGVSPYLYRRTLYAYYMSGANLVDHETDGDSLVTTHPDGRRELSAHGKVVKEWFAFTQKNPDRGVPWTPIGLMLDYQDGFSACYRMIWGCLEYTDADHMTYDFIYNIFPCTTKITSEHNGVGLVNTPYGDIFDVLMPNPPSGVISQELINNYKVQILLGDLRISKELAERLKTYVKDGGTLVVNVKQIGEYFGEDFLGLKLTARVKESRTARSLLDDSSFSSNSFAYQESALASAKILIASENGDPVVTLNKYGKGNVILTLAPYLMDKNKKQVSFVSYLLRRLSDSVLPVLVRGDIEYTLNRTESGWLITLLNNKGVYKEATRPAVVKPEEKAEVMLIFKEAPKALAELTEGMKIAWKKGAVSASITVPAGGVAVVKIQQ